MPGSRIEVLTEGILTRMIQSAPELPGVGSLIFDEFHERRFRPTSASRSRSSPAPRSAPT